MRDDDDAANVEVLPPEEQPPPVPAKQPGQAVRQVVAALVSEILDWQPRVLPYPQPPADLAQMSWPTRIATACGYAWRRAEYTLSSGGVLRAWFLLNLKLFLVAGIPLLFAVPLVTWLLSSLSVWALLLREIAVNLLVSALALLALGVVLCLIAGLLAGRRRS